MSDLAERLRELIDASGMGPKALEAESGLDRDFWRNAKYKRTRINELHIEAAVKLWPQYAYWLTTGKTIPDAGQISPEIELKRRAKEG